MHGFWLLLFVSAIPFTLRYIPLSALAAILVFTGYKLAYPKIVPTLMKYGMGEVFIYFVTIVMIVATNLLEGVLVGLGLSLIKLLYAFSHLDVRKEENGAENRVDLYLKGSATLIRLPKLAAELEVAEARRPGPRARRRARLHRSRLSRSADQLGQAAQGHRGIPHDRVGRPEPQVPAAAGAQRACRAQGSGSRGLGGSDARLDVGGSYFAVTAAPG